MIFFSVVIPSHQRQGIIHRAINSVVHQTFKDFEIIVVDDGSLPALVLPSEIEGIPIRTFRHEQAKGEGAARNAGVEIARGKYIVFLDDDDEFLPDYLSEAYSKISQNSYLDFIWASMEYYKNGCSVRQLIWTLDDKKRKNFAFLTEMGAGAGWVIRRELYLKSKGFDSTMQNWSDIEFCLKLFSSYSIKIDVISSISVRIYLDDANSLSRKANFRRKAKYLIRMLNRYKKFMELYPSVKMHYLNALMALLYRKGSYHFARKIGWMLIKANPFYWKTYEKFFRFERKRLLVK